MKSIYRNLSIALVMGTSTLAAAQDMAPTPPPASAPAPAAEKTMAFGASVFVGIPTGDIGDFVDGVVGVLGTIDYALQPQLEVTGRIGYMHYLVDGDGLTLAQIPLWGGARYFLAPGNQGLFVHGEAGINILRATVDILGTSSSDSNTELGLNLLAGFRQGKLIGEGGLYVSSLDDAGDSLMIGGTVGTTF